MEFLTALWVPILVSSAIVFFASFLTHMVLPVHKGDWKGLPNEEATLQSLSGAEPGGYMFPWGTMKDMKEPAFMEKMKRGPNGTVVIWPGPVNMGRNLILTFLSCIFIGVFIAYVLWHGFAGEKRVYMETFRIAGTAAFMAHGLGLIPHAIWYRGMKMWAVMFDAIVYALLTAGTFAWLWHVG